MNRAGVVILSTLGAATGLAGIGLLGYAGRRYWQASRRPRERYYPMLETRDPYDFLNLLSHHFPLYPENNIEQAQASGETGMLPLASPGVPSAPLLQHVRRPADPEGAPPGDLLAELSPATQASVHAPTEDAMSPTPEISAPAAEDLLSIRPPPSGFAAKGRPPIPKPRTIFNQGSPQSSMPRAAESAQYGRVVHHSDLTDEILSEDRLCIAF